jgi:hypothetical protein
MLKCIYLLSIFLLVGCFKSANQKSDQKICDEPQMAQVVEIGGCDAGGYCGVTVYLFKDKACVYAKMRYPAKGAIIQDYKYCYVPYKSPGWLYYE